LLEFVEDKKFDRLGVFNYSHEESTHAYTLNDNVPAQVKQERADRIMQAQQEISMELNTERIGKIYKVLIDRKETDHFIGRTEFDSPEVDNEVLIPARDNYYRIGDFVDVRIDSVAEFDLYGTAIPKQG
jgi:ribosomal protein S12 methylthiotransferase